MKTEIPYLLIKADEDHPCSAQHLITYVPHCVTKHRRPALKDNEKTYRQGGRGIELRNVEGPQQHFPSFIAEEHISMGPKRNRL